MADARTVTDTLLKRPAEQGLLPDPPGSPVVGNAAHGLSPLAEKAVVKG